MPIHGAHPDHLGADAGRWGKGVAFRLTHAFQSRDLLSKSPSRTALSFNILTEDSGQTERPVGVRSRICSRDAPIRFKLIAGSARTIPATIAQSRSDGCAFGARPITVSLSKPSATNLRAARFTRSAAQGFAGGGI